MTLAQEQRQLQVLLKGRTIKRVWRRKNELGIEFTDGTRLFVNGISDKALDVSVT